MRIIDTDALDNMLSEAQAKFRFGVLSNVRENIKEQPTIDAITVVRCCQCAHYDEDKGKCNRHEILDSSMEIEHPFWVKRNWYCADGERREEDVTLN